MKCLDTYALVSIHDNNPAYAGIWEEEVMITDLTLAEFYFILYKRLGLKTADHWHKKLSFLCRPVQRETLLKAMRFRADNKKKRLSFFDCAGYVYALENSMDFVTGDLAFKGMKRAHIIR